MWRLYGSIPSSRTIPKIGRLSGICPRSRDPPEPLFLLRLKKQDAYTQQPPPNHILPLHFNSARFIAFIIARVPSPDTKFPPFKPQITNTTTFNPPTTHQLPPPPWSMLPVFSLTNQSLSPRYICISLIKYGSARISTMSHQAKYRACCWRLILQTWDINQDWVWEEEGDVACLRLGVGVEWRVERGRVGEWESGEGRVRRVENGRGF